ncbi:hypothetical protein AB0M46_30960 [Dactylosporangium sp. NPDC051485]|uniref:hypothetical protein n=1 Tax=Dactylosporangium sp. NPDC051485 TaxID=3154846 RepID=UPI0034142EB9
MSTQPPDPTPTGAYSPTPAAAQYQTPAATPAAQALPGAFHQPQPQPQPQLQAPALPLPDAKKVRGLLDPYRELAAFALIGAAGIFLLAGLLELFTGVANSFLTMATTSFGNVVGFQVILMPILAVVLVTQIDTVTPRSKTIVLGALIEYAVAAVLGLVLLLAGLIGDMQSEYLALGYAFANFLEHLAGLGLIALGLFLTSRVFLGAYSAPKPVAPQYGQPGYGQYPQAYGYPQQQYAQPQTGYVTGAQPAAAAGYPAAYGQQQPATTGWSQQTGTQPVVTPGVIAGAAAGYPAAQQTGAAPAAPGYATPAAPTTGAPAAAPTSGGYAAPGYAAPGATPGYTAPAVAAPSFGAPATPPAAAAEAAQPVSASPLSSPFAAYTAPAPTPVADEPVSAQPFAAQPVSAQPASSEPVQGGGFASAGWPGGTSTHPGSGEEGTAVLSPAPVADPDATQQAPVVDADATSVLKPQEKGDDGEATQSTQAIPPSN